MTAIALGSCRVINIKQGKGRAGCSSRCKHRALCGIEGRPLLVRRHGRDGHRAGGEHPPPDRPRLLSIPGDTAETARYFAEDLVEPPVTLGAGGFIEVPRGAGIGVEVQMDRLDRLTISRQRIK